MWDPHPVWTLQIFTKTLRTPPFLVLPQNLRLSNGWYEMCSPHYHFSKRSKSFEKFKQHQKTKYDVRDQTRFLFEEHRKACIDAKTHYCSKGNKNIQKPSKPGFSGFSMKQATQLSDAIRMLTVNNSSVQNFRLAGIQL